MKLKQTLLSSLLAFAFAAPAAAQIYLAAPLHLGSSSISSNPGGGSLTPEGGGEIKDPQAPENNEDSSEIALSLRDGTVQLRLFENYTEDLSSFVTFSIDGAPADLDLLIWSVDSGTLPQNVSLTGPSLTSNYALKAFEEAPVTLEVSYEGESTQSSFTLDDNAPEVDGAFINALIQSAFEIGGPNDVWSEPSPSINPEELTFSAQQISRYPIPLLENSFYEYEGSTSDLYFSTFSSNGWVEREDESGKMYGVYETGYRAKAGPLSQGQCKRLVNAVSAPEWAVVALADIPSAGLFGRATRSERQASVSERHLVANQCEDGDYVAWTTGSVFY